MKKLFITLAIIFGIFIPQKAHADEFRQISIEANIDEKGIGSIEETWKINETNEDYTERYKTINNLRGLKIEDFSLEAFLISISRLFIVLSSSASLKRSDLNLLKSIKALSNKALV